MTTSSTTSAQSLPIDTQPFKDAAASAVPRPKAVATSPDLLRGLVSEGLVEDTRATPGGLAAPDLALDLPFYDGDVFVASDPRLVGRSHAFKLPLA